MNGAREASHAITLIWLLGIGARMGWAPSGVFTADTGAPTAIGENPSGDGPPSGEPAMVGAEARLKLGELAIGQAAVGDNVPALARRWASSDGEAPRMGEVAPRGVAALSGGGWP